MMDSSLGLVGSRARLQSNGTVCLNMDNRRLGYARNRMPDMRLHIINSAATSLPEVYLWKT
jgi:hypothetical protein